MPGRESIAVKQSIPKHLRYSFEDFNRQFSTDDACLNYLTERRFPGGVTFCKTCNAKRKHHRVSGRTAYACDRCGNHIYPLAGTILEKTTTSLRMWFYAMYLMGSTRCRISAKQVQREIGVTYKTAWRMFKQIRSILPKDLRLEGPVGIDETDFGGKRRKVRREFGQVGKRGRSPKGATTKTPIIGSSAAYGRKNSRKHRIGNLLGMVHEHIILDSTNSVEGFVR